jgi:MerR family transcriptional regulator, redox-sensitive transcriptional activator SoxR
MSEALMTIGQIATEAGLNTSAIRYYERNGVLPEAERVSGQRRYTADTLARLRIIDVAQHAGFSLEEIKVLLAATDAGTPPHERLQELAARKLPDIDALIQRAELIRAWLSTATGCGCDTLDVCGLFNEHAEPSITDLPIVHVASTR